MANRASARLRRIFDRSLLRTWRPKGRRYIRRPRAGPKAPPTFRPATAAAEGGPILPRKDAPYGLRTPPLTPPRRGEGNAAYEGRMAAALRGKLFPCLSLASPSSSWAACSSSTGSGSSRCRLGSANSWSASKASHRCPLTKERLFYRIAAVQNIRAEASYETTPMSRLRRPAGLRRRLLLLSGLWLHGVCFAGRHDEPQRQESPAAVHHASDLSGLAPSTT